MALEHAMSAVISIQELFLLGELKEEPKCCNNIAEGAHSQENKEKFTVLSIAYHNMGVEQEFLKRVFFI